MIDWTEPDYMHLGADAEAIAADIAGQQQAAIERLLMAPEGVDLTDPVADE